jgi:predicted GIY-YIG superfamily endonuclease
MFYVYVIKNETDDLYYGSTNDLRRRLAEHNRGKSFSTMNHIWTLIYYEAYKVESDAREREHQLKYHGQAKAQLKRRISASLQNKT